MDGPSNKVVFLSFCGFQILTLSFLQYILNKQNQFYAQVLSTQNLQIKELSTNLSKLSMLNAEQAQLILELQFQQKLIAGVTVTVVLVLGGFFLFFYSPGFSPDHMSLISDKFLKQNADMTEMALDIWQLKATAKMTEKLLQDSSAATELLLNAAEGFETASKALS